MLDSAPSWFDLSMLVYPVRKSQQGNMEEDPSELNRKITQDREYIKKLIWFAIYTAGTSGMFSVPFVLIRTVAHRRVKQAQDLARRWGRSPVVVMSDTATCGGLS